ncbi:MAG: hypothetical protein QM817_36835 [Archangium sp.]
MPPDPDFFPYHPIKLRAFLFTGAVLGFGLATWAVSGFLDSRVPLELLRAGFAGGLGAAMALTLYRYRPRDGWGVRITNLSVLISKPRGGLIEVPWSEVKEVRRIGDKRDTLALFLLEPNQRVLVPSHLFFRRSHFEALATRVDERRPRTATPHTVN